jgi:hypothetical protein
MKQPTVDVPQPKEAKPEMTLEEKEKIAVEIGAKEAARREDRTEPTDQDRQIAQARLKLEKQFNPHCFERLLDSAIAFDRIQQAIGEEDAQTLVIAIVTATNKYSNEFEESDLEGFAERVIKGLGGDWEASKEILDEHPEIRETLKEYVLNRLRYDTEKTVAITG